jgi:hypothetical protein
VLTRAGLVRYLVFFVMDLRSRRVDIAGISKDPDGEWMARVARNLTDAADGFLKGARYLIVDRDPLYTAHFKMLLRSADVGLVRLPARSPNLNGYAERFVRSIKQECLRHIVPLGERHLLEVVREYVKHYHGERNRQGLDNMIPVPPRQRARGESSVGIGSAQLLPSRGRVTDASEFWNHTGCRHSPANARCAARDDAGSNIAGQVRLLRRARNSELGPSAH